MSGHSHFATIKHKKAASDAQRGKEFSKLAKELTIAARDGGGDPVANYRLRMVIDKAKGINMPAINIDRAVKKGTGELEGEQLEEILVEGYGPDGIALLIEGITDNKNRSLGEIRMILEKNQGKMVGEGAVQWMFERKGSIGLLPQEKDREEIEMTAIDAGADDLYWHTDGFLEIYTTPTELDAVKTAIEKQGLKVESASLDWIPKERVAINKKEAAESLFEALDEGDSVQDVYSNLQT
tara:strand:+ start:290 stop:1006 length:717 start_codon:yes stop_codon:yes gene_type:complete